MIGSMTTQDARDLLCWCMENKTGPRGGEGLKEKRASEALASQSLGQFHSSLGYGDLPFPLIRVVPLTYGGGLWDLAGEMGERASPRCGCFLHLY